MLPTRGAELPQVEAGAGGWTLGGEDPAEDPAVARAEVRVAVEAVVLEADRMEAQEEGQAVVPMGIRTASIVSKT